MRVACLSCVFSQTLVVVISNYYTELVLFLPRQKLHCVTRPPWLCGLRLQTGVVAVLQFVHWVRHSPPVGDILPMEILPDPPKTAATMVTSLETDNLRSAVAPPDIPMLVSDVRNARRRAEPSLRELLVSPSQQCSNSPQRRSIPSPNGEIYPRAAPLLPPLRLLTSPPPKIDVSIRCAHDLGPSSSGRSSSRHRRGGSR